MADLTPQAAHEYWRQYADPMIYRVLCYMENVEKPKDENTLLQMILKELGKTLDLLNDDANKKIDFNKLDQREVFIMLANQLNMVQTLLLLQQLDTAQAGSAAQLLMHAETITKKPTDEAGIFLKRNLEFERLRLLGRIFSEERLSLVKNAVQTTDQ